MGSSKRSNNTQRKDNDMTTLQNDTLKEEAR